MVELPSSYHSFVTANESTFSADLLELKESSFYVRKLSQRMFKSPNSHEITALTKESDNVAKQAVEIKQRLLQHTHVIYRHQAEVAWREFYQEYEHLRTTRQDRLKRIFANLGIDEEKATEFANRPDANQLMSELIMSDDLKQTVSDIEARHSAIIKLEEDVIMVHEIFRDLATLVKDQQAGINHIEHNVEETKHHVKQAENELNLAEVHQTRNRKCKCILVCILLTVIIVILVPILLTSSH
jgi:syntaxin 1B/2/3